MRIATAAILIVLTGAASAASADPRILSVQKQVQSEPPAPPPEQAPAQTPSAPPRAPESPPPPAPAQAKDTSAASSPNPDQPLPPPGALPAEVPSRYSFQRVDGGFLRLDNESGQIAFCSPHTVGWACQAVPEDRAAFEREIARLQGEVSGLQEQVVSLRQEIASLREPPPPARPPADLTPHSDKDGGLKMPSDEEIARARVAVEHAWRRLVDMIVNFQKDMMP